MAALPPEVLCAQLELGSALLHRLRRPPRRAFVAALVASPPASTWKTSARLCSLKSFQGWAFGSTEVVRAPDIWYLTTNAWRIAAASAARRGPHCSSTRAQPS